MRVSQISRCGRNYRYGELRDAERNLLLASLIRRRHTTFVATDIKDTAHHALSLTLTELE